MAGAPGSWLAAFPAARVFLHPCPRVAGVPRSPFRRPVSGLDAFRFS